MTYGTRAVFNEIRSINFDSINGSYNVVGSALTDHARIVTFTNLTDAPMLFSLNGVDDQIVVNTDDYKTFNLSTNKIRDDGLFLPVGTFFYVKEVASAPTSGKVYIEVISAQGGT